MNVLNWLKSKAGKLPITLAQAAGITAVVGAAGFGAMSFLSSPADNNNTFLPPSANQGQVVYVSQGGGSGQYEANGEVGSSFKAAPSRAIHLANQEAARQAQTRALEESAGQQTYNGQPGEELNPQLPKAYQTANTNLGLGMGTGADKQLNSSLETFSTLQNQLKGVTEAVNKAQANAGQPAKPGAAAPGNTSGQTAAQLASAPRNWGSGGLTRAGGGSGSSNAFVVQDSGKNEDATRAAAAAAQAGNAIAQAQAAMAQTREGTRLRSRANFGNSDGLGVDKDAAGQGARRFGRGKDELTFIRKQTAAINANRTNAANEGGNPFLASTKISGGLTVSGDSVTTGTGSSGDLRSTFNTQMKGIGNRLGSIETSLEERTRDRHDLRKWMYIVLPLALTMIPVIGTIMSVARICMASINPIRHAIGIALKILGYVLAAVTVYTIYKLASAAGNYAAMYGSDGFSNFAKGLSYVLGAGVLASTFVPYVSAILSNVPVWTWGAAAAVGFMGAGVFDFLMHQGGSENPADLDDNAGDETLDERAKELQTKDNKGA